MELDEELGLARSLQDGLDSFQLDPGLLHAPGFRICATTPRAQRRCSVSTEGPLTICLFVLVCVCVCSLQ